MRGPDQNPKDSGTFQSWKDFHPGESSMFEYSDSTEKNINQKQIFPDNHFQENPEKM